MTVQTYIKSAGFIHGEIEIGDFFGLLELTDEQFRKIIELGQANERYFID